MVQPLFLCLYSIHIPYECSLYVRERRAAEGQEINAIFTKCLMLCECAVVCVYDETVQDIGME